MDHQKESLSYGDSTMLEPIVEQQDDEITMSPASSMDASFLEEERRAREETQMFEEFEREFESNRRQSRVKFGYSFDDENGGQYRPVTWTTRIKTEPYFRPTTTEDPLTKYFYTNEILPRTLGTNENGEIERNSQLAKQTLSRTPSEPDSLEEEYTVTFTRNPDRSSTMRQVLKDINPESKDNKQAVVAPLLSRPVGKSILKKNRKQEETKTKMNRSSIPLPPPSPSKKQPSSSPLDFNQVTNLAESSSKQDSSPSAVHPRSLFEATINIFDPMGSSLSTSGNRRPSRLRYYIKPYRGEANPPPDLNKHRSRSLSEQRIAEQTGPTRWYTFTNQYPQSSSKHHHVSWSPVREYIHHGRDKTLNKKSPTKRKETSGRIPSSMAERARLSNSNPCLSINQSMIPVSVRYRPSRFSQAPQHFRQSLPPSLANSLDSPSVSECPLTPTNAISHYNERYENAIGEEAKAVFVTPLPDVVHKHQKEHGQTMKRYEQLLEKMRATDEQLQSLSRSWMDGNQKPPVKLGRTSTMSLTSTTTSSGHFFSPVVLQMCLLILVIFNLLVVYFFNEINIWWNRFVVPAVMLEQHDGETSDY